MSNSVERKWDYGRMCNKGKRCVDTKMEKGESRSKAVRDCWKKVGVVLEDDPESRMAA